MRLKEGDIAPNFEFIDENGERKELHAIEGKKIVFFFPKAFTPGCTKEACSIQDRYEDLKEEGVSIVIGISMDEPKKLEEFKKQYALEYTLVSDKSKEISKKYGVAKNFLITSVSDRDTFVIGEDNKILKIFKNGLRGGKSKVGLEHHGEEILNLLANSSVNE